MNSAAGFYKYTDRKAWTGHKREEEGDAIDRIQCVAVRYTEAERDSEDESKSEGIG